MIAYNIISIFGKKGNLGKIKKFFGSKYQYNKILHTCYFFYTKSFQKYCEISTLYECVEKNQCL